jgi:flagellar hook-associated protein 1 FlgK
LDAQRTALLSRGQGVASEIDGYLAQIATLNTQIAQASAGGDRAPGLRDQQNALVTKVAADIGGQAVYSPSGAVTILAAGTLLVSDGDAATVGVGVAASGAMQITAKLNGGGPMDITRGLTEGTLGGLREARDTDMAGSLSQLDQFAFSFANAVNSVQSAGAGLDGVSGRALFTPPKKVAGAAAMFSVDVAVADDPGAVAASSTAAGLPGGNDAAVAMAQLASISMGTGGTPATQWGEITAQMGTAVQAANADATTRTDTLELAQNLDSSESGVALDEENVNLTRFQQAFEASLRVLQVTDQLISNLMTMMSSVGA